MTNRRASHRCLQLFSNERETMKFEDFLLQPSEDQRRRLALEEEVLGLQQRLDGELRLNSILRCAMRGPILSCHFLSPPLPFKVQVLLAELAMVEEEIVWLERKVGKLKMNLNQVKKRNREWELELQKHHHHPPKQLTFTVRHKHHPKQLTFTVQQQQQQLKAAGYDSEWDISPSLRNKGTISICKRSEDMRKLSVGSSSLVEPSFPSTRFSGTLLFSGPQSGSTLYRNQKIPPPGIALEQLR